MFYLICAVIGFTTVDCLIQGEHQNELNQNLTTENAITYNPNRIDSDAMREKLLHKLKTVENDPVYDYKDQWWKTIRQLGSTEPTKGDKISTKADDKSSLREGNKTTETKKGDKKVIKEDKETIKEDKETINDTKADIESTTLKKDESNKFNVQKFSAKRNGMNSLDLTHIERDFIPKRYLKAGVDQNAVDYMYDMIISNKSYIKEIDNKKPVTNDTEVKDSQKDDIKEMIKDIDKSKSIWADMPELNASNIIEYYNFTAKHFGDAALSDHIRQRPESIVETTTIKGPVPIFETSTWRFFKPSRPSWLGFLGSRPAQQEPSTIGYVTLSTTIATTPDFLTSLKDYKMSRREGYFSTFLTKLFGIMSDKRPEDIHLFAQTVPREYNILKKETFILDFGPAFLKVLEDFSVSMIETHVEYIKAYAELLRESIPFRKETLATGVASIIDFIDTLFNDDEGTKLFEALESVNKHPNTTENIFQIARKVTTSLFAPYLRHRSTNKAQILIEAINVEIQKAKNNTVVQGEPNVPPLTPLERSLRRLSFYSNKTRFGVVDRERDTNRMQAKKRKKTTRRNRLKDYTYSFYEVTNVKKNKQEKHPAYLRTTTQNDPLKMIGRFKIVTRSTKNPARYRPLRFITTTDRPEYQEKRPKMHKKYGTIKKLKQILQDEADNTQAFEETNKNINLNYEKNIKYKKNNTKNILTGRIKKHKPQHRPYKRKYVSTTRKLPKYTTASTHWDPNEVIIGEPRHTIKPSKAHYNMPIKKVIIFNTHTNKSFQILASPKTKKALKSHKKSGTKITTKKESKFHTKSLRRPKYTYAGPAFKANNKSSEDLNEIDDNEMLKKVTGASSYSDEENELRFQLNDALHHDDRYFKAARKSNVNIEEGKKKDRFSSYSNEEDELKSNIYRVIGFNHVRNTTFGGFFRRMGGNATAKKRVTVRFKPVNVPSSYSDEEDVLKKRLYN